MYARPATLPVCMNVTKFFQVKNKPAMETCMCSFSFFLPKARDMLPPDNENRKYWRWR